MKLKHALMKGVAGGVTPRLPVGFEARLQVDDAMAVRDIEAGRRISDETVRRAAARLLGRIGAE